MRRLLAAAVVLVAVSFPVAAQQPHRPAVARHRAVAPERLHAATAFNPNLALSLSQPNTFSSNDDLLLLHKGPLHAWSDGGRLASENALVDTGMLALDFFSGAYLPSPDAFGPTPANRGRTVSNTSPQNFGKDGKDSPGELMVPPTNQIYYGGEIGFLYGHSIGKGSGDMMESYIFGQVGNDHFQITAGAAYEQSSGQGVRFRSFNH